MCDPDRAAYPEPRPGRGSGCAPRGEVGNLPFISPGGSSCSLRTRLFTHSIQAHADELRQQTARLDFLAGRKHRAPELHSHGIELKLGSLASSCGAATMPKG